MNILLMFALLKNIQSVAAPRRAVWLQLYLVPNFLPTVGIVG